MTSPRSESTYGTLGQLAKWLLPKVSELLSELLHVLTYLSKETQYFTQKSMILKLKINIHVVFLVLRYACGQFIGMLQVPLHAYREH